MPKRRKARGDGLTAQMTAEEKMAYARRLYDQYMRETLRVYGPKKGQEVLNGVGLSDSGEIMFGGGSYLDPFKPSDRKELVRNLNALAEQGDYVEGSDYQPQMATVAPSNNPPPTRRAQLQALIAKKMEGYPSLDSILRSDDSDLEAHAKWLEGQAPDPRTQMANKLREVWNPKGMDKDLEASIPSMSDQELKRTLATAGRQSAQDSLRSMVGAGGAPEFEAELSEMSDDELDKAIRQMVAAQTRRGM